jgi:hypothetical protein
MGALFLREQSIRTWSRLHDTQRVLWFTPSLLLAMEIVV